MAAIQVERYSTLVSDLDRVISVKDKKMALSGIQNTLGGEYMDKTNFTGMLNNLIGNNWITYGNMGFLQKCLSNNRRVQEKIERVVQSFILSHSDEIEKYLSLLPVDFIGRERETEDLHNAIFVNNYQCAYIWGPAGVGKTTFVQRFCRRLERESGEKVRVVDLRGVTEMPVVFVSVLFQFGIVQSVKDVDLNRVLDRMQEVKDRYFLYYDNADYFFSDETEQSEKDMFVSLIQGLHKTTNLISLISSRSQPSFGAESSLVYSQKLGKLTEELAAQFVRSSIDERGLSGTATTTLSRLGGFVPLALSLLKAQLQEKSFSFEKLVNDLKARLVHNLSSDQEKENILFGTEEPDKYTDASIEISFNRLSDTIRSAAVSLSLFSRSFSMAAVRKMFFNHSEKDIQMIIIALKHFHFVNLVQERDSMEEPTYDLHPKVKNFLENQSETDPHYKERKLKFLGYFNEKLLSIARIFNSSYNNSFNQFEESKLDFETLLENSFGKEAFIILDNYSDLNLVAFMFEAMVSKAKNIILFKTWAEEAERRGNLLQAARCFYFYGLQIAQQNPRLVLETILTKAVELLESFEKSRLSFLTTYIRREEVRNCKIIRGLLLSLKSQCLFILSRYRQSVVEQLHDLKEGLKCTNEAIDLWPLREEDSVTEICRMYNSKGNFYSALSKVDANREELNRLAQNAYERSLEIRQKHINTLMHPDTPIILQSLAVTYENDGNSEKAVEYYKKALDLEKELNLEGYRGTALILKNLSDLYFQDKKFSDALPLAQRAYDIRKRLFGPHPDTIAAIYQVAVIIYSWGYKTADVEKYLAAEESYLEAFEVEESLPELEHSDVRMWIREDLIDLYDTAIEEGFCEFTERMRLWKTKLLQYEAMEEDQVPLSPTIKFFDVGVARRFIDKSGGLLEFKELGVSVTFPEECVCTSEEFKLECTNTFKYMIEDTFESVKSDILAFHGYKEEFRKECMLSIKYREHKYSQHSQVLVVRQVKVSGATQTIIDHDIERTELVQDGYSVCQTKINSCGFFAVCLKLKTNTFTTAEGNEIQIFQPFEYLQNLKLTFHPTHPEATSVTYKVKVFECEWSLCSQMTEENLFLSPVLIIDAEDDKELDGFCEIQLPFEHKWKSEDQVFIYKGSKGLKEWENITPLEPKCSDSNISFVVYTFSFWQLCTLGLVIPQKQLTS